MCRAFGYLLVFFSANLLPASDSSSVNDYEIASVVREAVRSASEDLLNSPASATWRDYLKVAATNLQMPLQPLLLIKFDGDPGFRSQLKRIVEWESEWEKQQTEHFIYYYRWDQPPPEVILHLQDAHFNEIVKMFAIKVEEKIPFRYDLNAEQGKTYPFDDLRGGIITPQPLDLNNGTLAILNFVNPNYQFLLKPLARIYGTYFQNAATSRAFYEKCFQDIKQAGYVSATELLVTHLMRPLAEVEEASIYAFVFDLVTEFGPARVVSWLASLERGISVSAFELAFRAVFSTELQDFEAKYRLSASKS